MQTRSPWHRWVAIALPLCLAAGPRVHASAWSPTLLVNTEATQVIDDADASANVVLQFGQTLGKSLSFDRAAGRFSLNDDLYAQGGVVATGTLSGAALTVMGEPSYLLGNVGIGTASAGARLTVVSGSSATVGAIVKGTASQSANLSEWQDNAAAVLASVDAAGNFSAANVRAGTYTPTLTNVANLSSSTAYEFQYLRVGNTVTVSGKVNVDPVSFNTLTKLGISLPVASSLGAEEDCAGVAILPTEQKGAAILADAANDRALMQWDNGYTTSNHAMFLTFTYQIR